MKLIKSEEEFSNLLKDNPGTLIVVDFYATWCGPCKTISPKIEAMEKEFGDVIFVKVDVDELQDLAEQEKVTAMPTFICYKNGGKVGSVTGASEPNVRAMIQKHK